MGRPDALTAGRRSMRVVRRYVVSLADGSMVMVSASRHRRFDDVDAFGRRADGDVQEALWEDVVTFPRCEVIRVERLVVSLPTNWPREN